MDLSLWGKYQPVYMYNWSYRRKRERVRLKTRFKEKND